MGTEIEKATAMVSPLEQAKQHAVALSRSNLLPKAFLNNPPNCMIAMEIANRIGAGVFQVAQNLHIIQGKPSWSATFLIATVNASGRWTPLKFRMQGTEGKPDWGCRAVATDKATGEECIGPAVTMAMAKAEGWSTKSGSKWVTMPEVMLHYRAAAFWSRLYAPELAMGIHTTDEITDMSGRLHDLPEALQPGDAGTLEAQLLGDGEQAQESEPATTEREPGSDDAGLELTPTE